MADVHVPKIAARPVAGDDGKALVYDAGSDAHVYAPLPEGGGGGGPVGIGDVTGLETALDNLTSSIGDKADLEAGKIPVAQLPDLAVVDYLGSAANQAAMLALSGEQGDWCVRADTGTTWIITGSDPSSLGSWTQLSYPTAPVTSVAGKVDAVTLVAADVSDSGATGRSLVQAADADAARTTLSLGGAATLNVGTTAGTVKAGDWVPAAGEIPDLPASKTTSGVFADARIPNLAASKITGGTFDVARLPVGTTAGTVKAGDWLPGVSEDEDNQATLGSDDLVFVPEPNLAGLPYLASSWLPGIEDQPSGYSPAVWYDEIEDEWPARPTARTDVFIRWCSVGDQGTPPGALARDFVEVYEESAPAFPGTVLSSYTFEGDSNGNPISPSSPWSQSGGGSTPFTASTAAAIHGSLGGRISEATQNRMLEHTSGSTHTNTRVVDVYIIPRAVSANSVFAAIRDLGASTTRGDIRINTDRTVTIRNGAAATATSTTVLALDTTYRIAWKTTASEGQSARIYNATGDLIETISGALSGNTHDNIRVGLIVASSGYSADYDSIRIGDDWLAPHA